MSIENQFELEKMQQAGYIARVTLNAMQAFVKPGITTRDLK